MAMKQHNTVVGVFEDRTNAQQAVRELKQNGFRDDQIGVVGHKGDSAANADDKDDESYVGEGAAAGLAAGAGIGALWGLGIIAGVLPVIGPAIAGGTLAVILSSAAAGAAAAGVAGALVGLGLSKEEADYYEGEFKAGRTIVTVNAGGRESEALAIIRRFHGYSSSDRAAMASSTRPHAEQLQSSEHTSTPHAAHTTLDVPVRGEAVGHESPAMSRTAGPAEEIDVPVRQDQVRTTSEQDLGEHRNRGTMP